MKILKDYTKLHAAFKLSEYGKLNNGSQLFTTPIILITPNGFCDSTVENLDVHIYVCIYYTPISKSNHINVFHLATHQLTILNIFEPGTSATVRRKPGFLKSFLRGHLYVCMYVFLCVCVSIPKAINNYRCDVA